MAKRLKGLAEWKKIYYPITATAASKESQLEAVNHSLKKWEGLDEKILDEFNINHDVPSTLRDADGLGIFAVHANTCSLCEKYYTLEDGDSIFGRCDTCPLYAVRGNVKCVDAMDGELVSPYNVYLSTGNVKHMVAWLRAAKAYAEAVLANPYREDEYE